MRNLGVLQRVHQIEWKRHEINTDTKEKPIQGVSERLNIAPHREEYITIY